MNATNYKQWNLSTENLGYGNRENNAFCEDGDSPYDLSNFLSALPTPFARINCTNQSTILSCWQSLFHFASISYGITGCRVFCWASALFRILRICIMTHWLCPWSGVHWWYMRWCWLPHAGCIWANWKGAISMDNKSIRKYPIRALMFSYLTLWIHSKRTLLMLLVLLAMAYVTTYPNRQAG